MKYRNDLKKKLNLNYLDLTNKTHKKGNFDLPELLCDLPVKPDFIALYTQPGYYRKTVFTCVAFYNYDDSFDGIFGLYNAIYYNLEDKLLEFKQRFSGVKFFISPDYSLCGDVERAENIHRMMKTRIVSLWLTFELKAIVIPNITYSGRNDFGSMLDGLENVHYVAFSTKGAVKDKQNRKLLIEAVQITVDKLKKLEGIVVYDVCKDNETVYEFFDYAISNNIKIIIPENSLKKRNTILFHERLKVENL